MIKPIILVSYWQNRYNVIIDFEKQNVCVGETIFIYIYYIYLSEENLEVNCKSIFVADSRKKKCLPKNFGLRKVAGVSKILDTNEKEMLLQLLSKYREIFSDTPGMIRDYSFRIQLSNPY